MRVEEEVALRTGPCDAKLIMAGEAQAPTDHRFSALCVAEVHKVHLWPICKKLLQTEGKLSVQALRSDLMKGVRELPESVRWSYHPLAVTAAANP